MGVSFNIQQSTYNCTMPDLCVVTKNVLNLYAGPSPDTELVTQVLMGEPVWILEELGEWARLRAWEESFSGWALRRWLLDRPEDDPYASKAEVGVVRALISDVRSRPYLYSDVLTKAVISTTLEVLGQHGRWAAVSLPSGQTGYLKATDIYLTKRDERLPPLPDQMIRTAKRFIGVPYLWGGTSPFGLDCSGFVQLVYRIHGIRLPRNSASQATFEKAEPVRRADLAPTDLVFFAAEADKGKVTHVGIWLGGDRFIHSAGGIGVTISELAEERYDSIYWGARRVVW